ncbi:glycosyltransferase [Candidatus Uhrbacteria bacterium]|nr:glycosyltransferase [Candidatus Uhrbacteria bacterium]
MKLLLTGGGTLGSVTPLLALREEFVVEETYWIGTRGGVEEELIQRSGIRFFSIRTGKFRRYFDWRTLRAPFDVIVGFFQALFLLYRLRPTMVFAAGGYVAVPVILAAWFLCIPSYTLQLDYRPGLTNRFVAPFVRKIFVVFPESARYFSPRKFLVTGGVVRKNIRMARPRSKSATERLTLLVLGGGTGALSLNELLWSSMRELTALCDVVHITGIGKSKHIALPHYESYTLVTDVLPSLLCNADCVITRAGMGTLLELALLKKAAIVVPLPKTHQEDNADLLAQHNAAVVVRENDLTPEKLVALVGNLLHNVSRREQLGENLYHYIPTDGAEKIVQHILSHNNG